MLIKNKIRTLAAIIAILSISSCSTVSMYDFSGYTIKQNDLKQAIIERYKEQGKYPSFEDYLKAIDSNGDFEIKYKELSDATNKINSEKYNK